MNYRLGETGKTELRGYRDGAQRNGRSLFPKPIRNWAAETLVEIPLRPVLYLVLCGGAPPCMVPAVMSHGPPQVCSSPSGSCGEQRGDSPCPACVTSAWANK